MSFPQKNKSFSNRDGKKRNAHFPIIVVILIISLFSFSWTRGILFSAGSPLWTVRNNIIYFFSNNIGVLNSKISLLRENDLLKNQIKSKEKDSVFFDMVKKENEELKNVLSRKKADQKFLLGSVLVKPFFSAYDTLVIDVGTVSKVNVGDKVLADGDIFIGYVSEVYEDNSKVVLYSSPGEKVKVLIGDNNIEKEAVGLGGGNFEVEIPREIDIKEGDLITIPSISTNIFGTVEKIEFKESDSFQNILFKNPANIAELKWVEVMVR